MIANLPILLNNPSFIKYAYGKKHFVWDNFVNTNTEWSSVIDNLDMVYQQDAESIRFFNHLGLVCHHAISPKLRDEEKLRKALYDYFGKKTSLHLYIALTGISESIQPHTDPMDVLIVQGLGQIQFRVWENGEEFRYDILPGMAVYLPAGTEHQTLVTTPRVTLSYGIED